ncbi:MAG TPA: RNA polymerase sigma factor [Chitinophagaceae bacterium]|nr:RNA polymerase sigma factor [Chitinophagaceae bacterium]
MSILEAERLMTEHEEKLITRADESYLVERLKKGDESAFKLIVETRKDLVFNTALGLLQNAEDAEDITQEVFIKVYESVHQFKGESAFSTWLYKIAVTKSLELIRSRKRKKRFAFITGILGENNELRHDPPEFQHPGVQLDNRERAATLFNSISKLPENQRVAFTLHKVEGIPYQEISEIMQLSISAVESLIHRAKNNLRKDLEIYYQKNR